MSGQVDLLLENLEVWLTGIEATRAVSSIEVRPEDSTVFIRLTALGAY